MVGFKEPYCRPTGKRIYESVGEARKAARAITAAGRATGTKMSPYVCRKCGGWHLGRK